MPAPASASTFVPQLNTLSEHIRQINHDQARPSWKDRIVSVLPEVATVVSFGIMMAAGVPLLFAAGFAGAGYLLYRVVKLVARKIQSVHAEPLISTKIPIKSPAPTTGSKSKALSTSTPSQSPVRTKPPIVAQEPATRSTARSHVINAKQQAPNQLHALRESDRIKGQKLALAEHQRDEALKLNIALQGKHAALKTSSRQTEEKLQQSQQKLKAEVHNRDLEITELQQHSTSLEKQLDTVRAEVSDTAEQATLLQRNLEHAQSKADQRSLEIDQFKKEAAVKDSHIESLQHRKDQLEGHLKQLTENYQRAQHEQARLNTDIDTLRQQQEKALRKQSHLENRLRQAESVVAQQNETETTLNKQLNQAEINEKHRKAQFQNALNEYDQRMAESNQLAQKYQNQAASLQARLNAETNKNTANTSAIVQLKSQLQSVETQRTQQLQDRNTLHDALITLKDQHQASERQYTEDYRAVQQQLQVVQEENAELKSSVDQTRTELLKTREHQTELINQLQSKTSALTLLKRNKEQLTEQLQQALKAQEELQKATVESQAALREQQRNMQDEQERSKDLQTNLEKAATELSSLRSNGSEMEQRLRTLKAEREHIKQQLQEKTIELENLRSCLQDQQQVSETLKKVEHQKHTTQLENEALQSEIDLKKTELLNAHKDKQGLLDQLKHKSTVFEALKREQEQLNEQHQQALKALLKDQVESQAALSAQQRQTQDEQERSQTLQTNLDEVTSEFSTLQSKSSEMSHRLHTLETEQEQHVQKLQEMTDKQKIELNDRDRVNQQQQDRIQQLQSKSTHLTELNDGLEELLAEAKLEVRSTKESLAEVKNLLQQPDKESEAKVRDLQDQLDKEREDCRLLRTELDSYEYSFAEGKERLVQKLRAEALSIKEKYDRFFKGKEDPLSLEIPELNRDSPVFSPQENQASTEFTRNEVETQQPYKKAASTPRDFTVIDTACKEVIESTEQIITRMESSVKALQKELGRKEREKTVLATIYAKEANDRIQKSQTLYSLQHDFMHMRDDVMHMRGPEDGISTELNLNWLKTVKSRSHSLSNIHAFHKLQDWEQNLLCHDIRLNFQKPITPETTDPDSSYWLLTVPLNDESVLPDSSISDESSDVESTSNPDQEPPLVTLGRRVPPSQDIRHNLPNPPVVKETTDPDSHWPLTVPLNDASVLPDSSIPDESSDVETKPDPDDAYADDDDFPLLPDSNSSSCLSSPYRKIIPNSLSLPLDLRGTLPGEEEPPLVTLSRWVAPGWSRMSQF